MILGDTKSNELKPQNQMCEGVVLDEVFRKELFTFRIMFFLKKLNEQYIHIMKNKLKSWTPRRHFSSLMFCNVTCSHSNIEDNIEWL